MKTIIFFLLCALFATVQTQAFNLSADHSITDIVPPNSHIICTIINNGNSSYASGEFSTVSCTCTEVVTNPEIEVKSNVDSKNIHILGAMKNDEIFILAESGEILMYLVAGEDNPYINVSLLKAGKYTIGVQR